MEELQSNGKSFSKLRQVSNYREIPRASSEFSLRQKALRFLLWAYGGLLFFTICIFVFQGFNLWGFKLETAILHWLGGATVGEIGGLLTLAYGYIFKRDPNFQVREIIRIFEQGIISEEKFVELLRLSKTNQKAISRKDKSNL